MMARIVFFIEKKKKKESLRTGYSGKSEKLEKQRENRKKSISRGIFSL